MPLHSAFATLRTVVLLGVLFFAADLSAQAVPVRAKGPGLYVSGDPTAEEQLVLEYINRARANPTAEGARLGIDIQEGLSGCPVTSVAAVPPLAMNIIVLGTALAHSQDMYVNNYFAHHDLVNPDDSTAPGIRMTAAGYHWEWGGAWGENIAASSSASATDLEDNLMIDSGYSCRGHRVNLFSPNFREIGVGYYAGGAVNSMGLSDLLTQDFGRTDNDVINGPFLVGVVYDDKNGNNFYDIGEGISGVTITASADFEFYAVSSTSGGYTLPIFDTSGSMTVTATSASFGTVSKTVSLTGKNVKVDFTKQKWPIVATPTRITTNLGQSYFPSVAVSGSYVYVAWHDWTSVSGSGSESEVWLRVSSDSGASFGTAVRISRNTGRSEYPSVAASGSYVYVAWDDWTPVSGSGSVPEIWMRISSNYGASFGSAIRMTTNTGYSEYASVAAAGSYVYLTWDDNTPVPGSGSASEIWIRVSSNNGASFGSPIRLTKNTGTSYWSSVAAVASHVYVTWMDNTLVSGSGGAYEIWMRGSSNNGASFGSPIRLTSNTGDSEYASVAAAGSYVYVAWMDDTPLTGSGGSYEIWMRVSSNNGGSFGSAVRMSTNTGYSSVPSVAAAGSYVYVAWQDDTPVSGSGGQPEIWLRVSSNSGASFGSAIRLSTNIGYSGYPCAAASGNYAYVAWEDSTLVAGSGGRGEIWCRAVT